MTPYQLDAEAKHRNSVAICFVCSLSDFFHEGADHWRADAWQVIRDCTNVKFMLLTKRPERIVRCLPADWDSGVYRNAWLGVTCGVRSAHERVNILRSIPCDLRFLSIEPLMQSVANVDLSGIGWVAVGGMSGPLYKKHRMDLAWAAEIYDRCQLASIPFLFKQSSNFVSERGINGLSLFLEERAGRQADPAAVPLLRAYPETELPLLPFVEYGQRFSAEDYAEYQQLCSGCS
jgi:protein gp37